LYFLQPKKQRN